MVINYAPKVVNHIPNIVIIQATGHTWKYYTTIKSLPGTNTLAKKANTIDI